MKRLMLVILFLLVALSMSAQVYLGGRTVLGSLPIPTYTAQTSGIVVVSIWVDQYGTVQKAIPGADGTTVADKDLWEAARKAAMGTHFNMSADAPSLQQGTITYKFNLAENASNKTSIAHNNSSVLNHVERASNLSEMKRISSSSDEAVFKFLGIPIDGTKEAMISALEENHFNQYYSGDYLTGIFNGENVRLYIGTNHGIVDMITVEYPRYSDDNDTRVKYNTLLSRFNRNSKYISINPRIAIPIEEKIYFKLNKNSKYYDAVYFFLQPDIKRSEWVSQFKQEYQRRYNKSLDGLSYEELEEALFCLSSELSEAVSGIVWFTLTDPHRIKIHYVNLGNRPHGEDL